MSDSAGSTAHPRPPHDGPQVLRVTGAIGAGEPLVPGAAEGRGDGADGAPRASGPVLVLATTGGTTFHLPVDGALRAALRQASTTPAPEGRADAPEPPLRPKDIQTRIRAGESALELAESSGAPLVQIERYAGPVLAERAHVATVARSTVVRTSRSRPTLEDLVRHRLASRGVALASVEWDAWRRGEHGWALQVSFRAGTRDRLAQWSYDPDGESVEPLDDEARWLSASHEADAPGAGRRLSAVRVFDVESDGGLREVPSAPGLPLVGDAGPATGSFTGLGGGAVTGGASGSAVGSAPGSAAGPPAGTGGATSSTSAGATSSATGPDPEDEGSGPLAPWTVPDHDEVAARTMDLLDALSDRRGRRQPVPDLGPGGGWDEDDEDDDLVDALLDDLPGSHARPGDQDGDGLPVFGSLPLTPLLEPHLRSVPSPEPAPGGADDDRDEQRGEHGDREPVGREPVGRPEGPAPERPSPLGLVPPLAEPATPDHATASWAVGTPISSRDLLSVREGRIGRSDAAELELADTGELSPAQVRELHERSSSAPPAAPPPAPSPAREEASGGGADAPDPVGEQPTGGPDDGAARPGSRPRTPRRSSVPSWDEIVFGSPRPDAD